MSVPPRHKRPDTRRQELLDAALELFLDRGVGAPTVGDIAQAAGAAKGTFYLYFPSKTALLAALRTHYSEELVAAVAERLKSVETGDWPGRIEAYVRAAVDFYLAHRRAHDVLFHVDLAPDAGAVQNDPVVEALRAFIEEGQAAGALAVADPPTTAVLLFSAVHGGLDHELRRGSPDRDRLARAAVELVNRALGLTSGDQRSQ